MAIFLKLTEWFLENYSVVQYTDARANRIMIHDARMKAKEILIENWNTGNTGEKLKQKWNGKKKKCRTGSNM